MVENGFKSLRKSESAVSKHEAEKLKELKAKLLFADDMDYCLKAVESDLSFFAVVSDRLKKDKNFLKSSLKHWPGLILDIPVDRLDKELLMAALSKRGDLYQYVVAPYKWLAKDRDLLLCSVSSYGKVLTFGYSRFKADKEIVLAAVRNDGQALAYASKSLKDDQEVVLAAVDKDVANLSYASLKLRDSARVIWLAAEKDFRTALVYASDRLRDECWSAGSPLARLVELAMEERAAEANINIKAVIASGKTKKTMKKV